MLHHEHIDSTMDNLFAKFIWNCSDKRFCLNFNKCMRNKKWRDDFQWQFRAMMNENTRASICMKVQFGCTGFGNTRVMYVMPIRKMSHPFASTNFTLYSSFLPARYVNFLNYYILNLEIFSFYIVLHHYEKCLWEWVTEIWWDMIMSGVRVRNVYAYTVLLMEFNMSLNTVHYWWGWLRNCFVVSVPLIL